MGRPLNSSTANADIAHLMSLRRYATVKLYSPATESKRALPKMNFCSALSPDSIAGTPLPGQHSVHNDDQRQNRE